MISRIGHDILHTIAVLGSVVTVYGAMHAEAIQMACGIILGVGGALWSWWIQQQAKVRDEQRRQESLDAEEKRRRESLDADARRDREMKDFKAEIEKLLIQQQAGVKVQ